MDVFDGFFSILEATVVAYEGQFVKIPNRLIRTCSAEGNLAFLGAYAVMSYFLQLPTPPIGGLRHALYKHASDGMFTVARMFHDLRDSGLLLRNRLYAEQRFQDRYLLRPENEGSILLSSIRRTRVLLPEADFLRMPLEVVLDADLSFAAKGLFLVIRRQQELIHCGVPIHLTKKHLCITCHKREQAFHRIWSQLKGAGYLVLRRRWNAPFRTTDCEILLSDAKHVLSLPAHAASAAPFIPPVSSSDRPREKKKKEPGAEACGVGRVELLHQIREQIQYATLARVDLEATAALVETLFELYRRGSGETIRIGTTRQSAAKLQAHLRALKAEDFAALLDAYRAAAQKKEIRSPKRYFAVCLLRYQPAAAGAPLLDFMASPSYDLEDLTDAFGRPLF